MERNETKSKWAKPKTAPKGPWRKSYLLLDQGPCRLEVGGKGARRVSVSGSCDT